MTVFNFLRDQVFEFNEVANKFQTEANDRKCRGELNLKVVGSLYTINKKCKKF